MTHAILFYGVAAPAEGCVRQPAFQKFPWSLPFDHGPTSDPLAEASEMETLSLTFHPCLLGLWPCVSQEFHLQVLALCLRAWVPASLPRP